MNSMQTIPFVISSSKGYSEKNNNADLINLFVHAEEAGSKSNHILINTEGAELLAQVPHTIYGVYEFKDVIYVATSELIYVFDDVEQVFTPITGEVDFDRPVSISDNGIDIIFVAGNGYAYTPSTDTLKNMDTELGWYPADTVAYMDGYFIFNRSGTGQFFISKLYSTEIDPIDWASAESAPDDTLAVVVSNRQLWLFGEKSTEVWYDSGDADFPFTRINGAVTDVGLVNHQSVAKIRDNIFFVGNDFKVYVTNGYTPSPISTPAIEKLLDKSDSTLLNAFTFHNNGHWFYALDMDDDKTYVYDIDTAQWHRRMSCDTNNWFIDGTLNRNKSNNLVGYADQSFYLLSILIPTENGKPVRREAVSLPINNTVNRFILSEVQLDMEVGFDTEGQIILQTTNDGGVTYSNNNYASTGAIGQNRHRARWLRLGQYRDCSLKIVITDPIPIRILGLHARLG